MKKFKYIALLVAVFSLGACSYEMKEKFDDNATERIAKAIAEYHNLLQSAPNGWIVYYFADTQYGGYNLLLKFEKDSVTAWSELRQDSMQIDGKNYLYHETSHYRLEQSGGVVLSFDEYNNIIHKFSDPNSKIAEVGQDGEGYNGDHEWRFISYENGVITLRGKKHNSRIEMVQAPASYPKLDENGNNVGETPFSPEFYFDSLKTVILEMNSANVVTTVAGDSVKTTKNADYNMFSFAVPQENGTTSNTDKPFVYKLDGIYLYSPLEINGHSITAFKYEPDKVKYYDIADPEVILHCLVLPINQQIVEKYWYINSEEDLGPYAGPIFRNTVNAIYESTGQTKGENCIWARIGSVYFTTGAPASGFVYFCYNSGNYICQAQYSYELEGEETITLKQWAPSTYARQNSWTYYTEFGLGNCADVFKTTFDIQTNSVKAPRWVILKDRNNAQNVIKLYISGLTYPFGRRED